MKRIGLLLLALLLLLPLIAFADEYTMPEKKEGKEPFLFDGDDRTFVTVSASITVGGFAECATGVYVSWFTVPEKYRVEYLDANGTVLKTETYKNPPLREVLPLGGAAELRIYGNKLEIAELYSVREGDVLPSEPNGTPCDALVLLTHVGDESLVAAPLLQELTERGLVVQVVYLYEAYRDRKTEVIDTLNALGIRRLPVFVDRAAPTADTYEAGSRHYNITETRKLFGELLETYAPALWFTDALGAGRAMQEQLALVTKNVAKHYAITESGTLVLSLTEAEAQRFGEAYLLQTSQRLYRRESAREVRLELLTADAPEPIWDGLDTESLLGYAAPTPLPTPESTETPSPEPTEQPTEQPTPEPTAEPTPRPTEQPTEAPLLMSEPQPSQTDSAPHPPLWLIVGGLVVLAVLVTLLILVVKRRR